MIDPQRKEIADSTQLVVIKIGTRVLTRADNRLEETRIADLVGQLANIHSSGKQVILVSSGAVGAGLSRLDLQQRPSDVARLQAIAAIGQTHLMETYDRAFRQFDLHAAQVLLTAEDPQNRTRYLNVRNALRSLLDFGSIPVINENDTVAVDELVTTFGDNDHLAALVANLVDAPLLVMLSHVDGLYDGPPESESSQIVDTVDSFDEKIWSLVRDTQSETTKGGMLSKLQAAQMMVQAGQNAIIAGGRVPKILARIMQGESLGTLILSQGKGIPSRKRWIGFSSPPVGHLAVDDGANQAICQSGKSLLAIGITAVSGEFSKGDIVAIVNGNEREIARGLCNYSHEELQRIIGLKSDRIADVLGHCPYDEVVHRDNLTVLESQAMS